MTDYRAGLQTFPESAETSATLDVEGALPPWLDGTLLRNGPGRFAVGGSDLSHWFDGLALPRRYGFDPESGAVDYRVRYLRSETYRGAREGRLVSDQFDTPAGFATGLRGRLARLGRPSLTDNASVSLARVGDRLAAVTETPRMVALDPETLESGPTFEHDDGIDLTGSLGHVHHDPARGEMVNLGVRYGRESEYVLTRRPDGTRERDVVARVGVDRPSYVHSFALTPRYAVVTLSPFVTRPRDLLLADTFLDAFSWRPERGTRFLVVDRETGDVSRLRTDPFLVFHHAAAFEADDRITLDLVAHPDHRAVTGLSLAALRSGRPDLPAGRLRRFRLDLADGTVTSRTLHEGAVEFPTLDYGAAVRDGQHRVVYLAATDPDPPVGLSTRVDRLDLATDDRRSWAQPGTYPGEPLFVPRVPASDRDAETDEGVLLVELLDPDADRTALVVLDAQTLDRLARVELPHALPLGFHGQYLRPGHPHERSMA
ncbi:MAG: carotenoid oxygenase family protein [Haloferacaceae archaeon]